MGDGAFPLVSTIPHLSVVKFSIYKALSAVFPPHRYNKSLYLAIPLPDLGLGACPATICVAVSASRSNLHKTYFKSKESVPARLIPPKTYKNLPWRVDAASTLAIVAGILI